MCTYHDVIRRFSQSKYVCVWSTPHNASIWWRHHVFRYRIVLTHQESYPHLGCHVRGGDDWQPLKKTKREISIFSKHPRIHLWKKYDFAINQTIIELLLQKSIPVANAVLMPMNCIPNKYNLYRTGMTSVILYGQGKTEGFDSCDRWIRIGVIIKWSEIVNFSACVTSKFDRLTRKNT